MNHGLIRLDSTEHWDALAGAALYLQGPAPPRKNSFHFCRDILTCFTDLFISCCYWNTCLRQTDRQEALQQAASHAARNGLHLHKNSMSSPSSKTYSCSGSQEILHTYGKPMFITVFTTAHHLSLSSVRWDQPTRPRLDPFQYCTPNTPKSSKRYLAFRFPCMHCSSPLCMPRAPPITSSLIRSPEQYLVRSTSHEVPRYVIFFSLLLLHLRTKYPTHNA